jgi:hypothetical protein
MLKANPLFGEGMHPPDKLTGEINAEKVAFKFLRMWMSGNDLMVEVQLTPNASVVGKAWYVLVNEYGAIPGISSRAFGNVKKGYVHHDSYKYITHDLTFNPSTPNAFLTSVQESTEFKNIVEECNETQLAVLNESMSFLVEDEDKLFSDHFINKNNTDDGDKEGKGSGKKPVKENHKTENHIMEKTDLIKLTEQVADLSTQVGTKDKEIEKIQENNTSLTEQVKTLEQEKEDLQAQLDKANENYQKSLEVAEGLTEKCKGLESNYKTSLEVAEGLTEKCKGLESNYKTSLEVAEGLESANESLSTELVKVKGYYEKSLGVFTELESSKLHESKVALVEKELGESYETHKDIFDNCPNMESVGLAIESLKKAKGDPYRAPILDQFKKDTTSEGEENKNAPKLTESQEWRVGMY